jgi:hypothetical protein
VAGTKLFVPSGCQFPAGAVPYSDQQIAFRAGVTLRAIAGRRLGQLENNQATVFCARRDRKNFSGSRGAGLCVYFRLMAHSTRRAFKSHGRAGSGRLQSNALRSKHRYTGRRARERSVQAQPTPSAEDRFPRLPPKGRFALSPAVNEGPVVAQTRHGQPRPDERLSRSPSEAGSGLTERPVDANRLSTAQ